MPAELPYEHLATLFTQQIAGVFVMTLDEPIDWRNAADRDAALDHAFHHLRLTAVNDAMCAQLGEPRERLLGTTPADRWTSRQEAWRVATARLYDEGQLHTTMHAPYAGGWMVVEGEYACTYDDRGRITGHLGLQRDVTDRVRINERLQAAVVGGDLGVWEIDFDQDTMVFEGNWLDRFGYTEPSAPLRASWWQSKICAADLPELASAWAAHAEGKTPRFRTEYRIATESGELLSMLASGTITARGTDGRPLRMVGATVDTTERRRLQARLAASERLAALGTLAAGVAHEINNPLTYIALTLELFGRELGGMRETAPPATLSRLGGLIEQMREGTERVRRIVRDLQSLSRVPDDVITAFDPVEVVNRCLAIADHQIRHRARIDREFGPVPRVRGDVGRAEQVFLNLLVNAAQAIPEGAADQHWIRVTTATARDGRAVIEVSDSGAGIPPEVAERIFDPFYTTKPIGEGTGLGLAIARSIVIAMGGDIEVESTPGKGATFRVSLPAASAAALAPALPRAPSPRPPGGLRVLVVDDERAVGESVADILGDHDVAVETSGRAALARLRAGERFDRILCDLMMPEITGMDFYDQLAAIDPALPARVVFVTGGAFTERARSFLARVPNQRLDKPFDLEQLLSIVAG